MASLRSLDWTLGVVETTVGFPVQEPGVWREPHKFTQLKPGFSPEAALAQGPRGWRRTPKSPPTRRVPPRGTPRVPAPLPLSPFSPPDRDRMETDATWRKEERGGSVHIFIKVSFGPGN